MREPDRLSPIGAAASPFDRYARDYDEVLNKGLSVSGENARHFAQRRVDWLAGCLKTLGERPEVILDYGCGHGSSAPVLLDRLGATRVIGVEASSELLSVARETYVSPRIRFFGRSEFEPDGTVDLAFCNGVFHHVPPEGRAGEVRFLRRALRPGGLLAFWENNPWNPGTRYVMSRIAFDAGAVPLSFREARRLVRSQGFEPLRCDHLFVFPRALKAFRGLEPSLSRFPIGAQYQLLCRKTGYN